MNAPLHDFAVPGLKTINANGSLIHYFEQGAGWRYDTLLDKEPETIEWIDSFEPGDVLWDIGANVGIYSIYAGVKGVRTFAFEPHFANYHQFCTTIALNDLQDRVTPLCLAFAETKSISEMHLASLDIGTSMSNFGEALDFRGNAFRAAFRQGMVGYDIDSFIADFGMGVPTHLKIDVDGIELPIVKGARRTLADPRLKSVSIELIETDEAQVAAVTEILEAAGLRFVHKKQNMAFSTADTTDVLNFLFHRDPTAFIAKIAAPATVEEDEESPVTIDELVARVARRIATAPIDPLPSSNIFMEDMLPRNVYRELLARLPGDDALDPIIHPDAITEDGRRTRFLLDLTAESLSRFAPEDQEFWAAMIELFTAPEIAQAVVSKFAPELRQRFGDSLPDLVAVPILYRDFPGYRIGVHPDTARKIATLQFYLPEDESQLHLGTSFHLRTAQGFEKLKTNAFKPNAAYGFVRTEESWHSVDELGPDEKVRNTIALTFYIRGQEYRSERAPAAEPVTSDIYDEEMAGAMRTLATTFSRPEDVSSLFLAGGTGVMLGVGDGDLSERVLDRSQVGYLYSVDSWTGEYGFGGLDYRNTIVRLSTLRDRSEIIRMPFNDALGLFGDGSLDFLYLNGYAHDGELNGQLLRTWYAKVRPGGIIAGNDYAPNWPLVMASVDDFVARHGLERHLVACRSDNGAPAFPTWFAMKP